MTRAERFITLEGIEGAGKSTLARGLQAALQSRGLRVLLSREPGGTPLAERLRSLLLDRGHEQISPTAETLLMFAARSVHIENSLRPAQAGGAWVICDRFTDATRAYQGAGRGVDSELIERLAGSVHADFWPQCTLLLDIPVEQGLARARGRGDGGDRFEDEDLRFFERVRRRYLSIAEADAGRVRVLDARLDPEELLRGALEALRDLLP